MSAKIALKSAFPEEAAKWLVGVFKGEVKFDRWTAIGHGMTIANYLVDLFGGSSGVKSKAIKAGRVTKKQIAEALSQACSGAPSVKVTVPAWLLPVLLKLVQKWLDGSK